MRPRGLLKCRRMGVGVEAVYARNREGAQVTFSGPSAKAITQEMIGPRRSPRLPLEEQPYDKVDDLWHLSCCACEGVQWHRA